MAAAPRKTGLGTALMTVLPLAGIGGGVYLHQQHIPVGQAAGILAAFLIEAALFLATGSEAARARVRGWPRVMVAGGLVGLAGLTWALAGGGALWQLAATVGVTAVLAWWYVLFPEHDAPLLVIYGALALGKVSGMLYPAPWAKAPLAVIGELAWLRTLLVGVLIFRRPALGKFGFFPTAEEWRAGVKWFLLFAPVAVAVGVPIGFAKLRTLPADPARLALAVAGTFAGHFVFVALREELLFRGLLLGRLQKALGGGRGLLLTSVLFGAVHLPFGQFPNWRFAVVATIAGWFYGKAYLATGSIRSAMVTHALTNVMARVFLST